MRMGSGEGFTMRNFIVCNIQQYEIGLGIPAEPLFRSSSLWSLLHSPFSSLLCPNIHLRILFSNTKLGYVAPLKWNLYIQSRIPLDPFRSCVVARNSVSGSIVLGSKADLWEQLVKQMYTCVFPNIE